MYLPKHNTVSDESVIADFVQRHSFGILISAEEGVPFATHVPMEFVTHASGEKMLYGHVARANPHWRLLAAGKTALAIFSGPHAYVSAKWYDHVNVPTWNYMTVHAYGEPRVITEAREVSALLKSLVDRNEVHTNPEAPYQMESLTPDYLRQQFQALVCFEMKITRLEAKFKLSQNRDAKNFYEVMARLRASGEAQAVAVAEAMAQIAPQLFHATE